MRQFWTSLLCIIFMMSGTLVTAAHTLAHIQPVTGDTIPAQDHDHHENDAHHDGNEATNEHNHSDDTGDHGHELHVSALDVAAMPAMPAAQLLNLRAVYNDRNDPAPILPSDPYPDRA
jgi:ABC-type Zn2+ transport system substrate-binding protein/surface adhesin